MKGGRKEVPERRRKFPKKSPFNCFSQLITKYKIYTKEDRAQ
jgi:hypothetical protein